MIRLALYIILAIVFALSAVWFADHPGALQINWQGWEVRMSMAIFSFLVLLYSLSIWILFKLYRWFKTGNPLTSPKRQATRREKGLTQLDLGWSAMAVKDNATALKHGKKAQRLLGFLAQDNGPLRLLLAASEGKEHQKFLTQSEQKPNMKLLVLKSRLDHETDEQKALDILQEMEKSSPANPWIKRQIFDRLTHLGKWVEAREELNKMTKAKMGDAAQLKSLTATLCYSQALEADIANKKTMAKNLAQESLKNNPSFIPAALLLGRFYLSQGDKTRARKVIEAIWKIAPHPDLGELFLKLDPMESSSEKFKRVQKLTKLNMGNINSLHFLAKVALDTEHWADAKQALDKIISAKMTTQETYHLLARLETLQKQDEAAAAAYLALADTAENKPNWQCDTCHHALQNYTATCPECHSYGHINWS